MIPAALVLALVQAGPAMTSEAVRPFLKAGQEAVIARMVSVEPEAAGGLTLGGADVSPHRIEARYVEATSDREVHITLVHPGEAPPDAPGTDAVAILSGDGSPLPPALVEALLASLRAHGRELSWSIPDAPAHGPRDAILGGPVERPPPRGTRAWGAFGLLVSGLLIATRRRYAPEARLPQPPGPSPAPWGRADTALLLVLLLGALGLRLVHLEARPIEADEATALGPLPGPARWAREAHDARFKPPLYPQLARIATRQTSDIVAARAVSVAAGVLTVLLVFVLVRRRVGREAALLAGTLVATAGVAVFVSGLARSYALLGLTVLAAHAALHRALDRGGSAWEVYTALAVVALLTDYLALAPILAAAAFVMLGPGRPRSVRLAAGLSSSAAFAAVAFLVPVAWPTLAGGLSPESDPASGFRAASIMAAETLGGALPVLGLGCLLALGALTLLRGEVAERTLIVGVAGVVLATILGGLVEGVRPRYLIHALPLLAVAFGGAAVAVPALPRRLLLGGFLATHALLLPDLYAPGCNRAEVCSDTHLSSTMAAMAEALASDAVGAVLLAPASRVDDVLYRLHRHHAGRASVHFGRPFDPGDGMGPAPCPTLLCYPAPDVAYYVADEAGTGLEAALGRHRRALLLVHPGGAVGLSGRCAPILEEDGHVLHRCDL